MKCPKCDRENFVLTDYDAENNSVSGDCESCGNLEDFKLD